MQTPKRNSQSTERRESESSQSGMVTARKAHTATGPSPSAKVVDLEQELKSMHLTWRSSDRQKPIPKSTFSKRNHDIQSKYALDTSSAAKWEIHQVADLASRLADSLYSVHLFIF